MEKWKNYSEGFLWGLALVIIFNLARLTENNLLTVLISIIFFFLSWGKMGRILQFKGKNYQRDFLIRVSGWTSMVLGISLLFQTDLRGLGIFIFLSFSLLVFFSKERKKQQD